MLVHIKSTLVPKQQHFIEAFGCDTLARVFPGRCNNGDSSDHLPLAFCLSLGLSVYSSSAYTNTHPHSSTCMYMDHLLLMYSHTHIHVYSMTWV